MSICRARLRNTSNALTLRMSSEQIRLHVSPKLFGVNSRQWIPNSWSGDRKCTGPKGAAANSRNWQLMTFWQIAGQVLATSNFKDWHTVVVEIPWSSVPKTTMDCHSKLVLHSLIRYTFQRTYDPGKWRIWKLWTGSLRSLKEWSSTYQYPLKHA